MSAALPKTLLVLSLVISPLAYAKPHMIAEVGKISCLDKAKNPTALLQSLGVTIATGKRKEIKLVANIGETVIRLTNQAAARRIFSGLKVYFKKDLGNTRRGSCLPAHQLIPSQIHMARKCPNGWVIPNVEGIFVHELGHFVANKRGLYPKYNRSVSKKCKLSNYMSKNSAGTKHRTRNEEFAEVFAAYLIHGRQLKRKCPGSYEFMRKNLFLESESNCR